MAATVDESTPPDMATAMVLFGIWQSAVSSQHSAISIQQSAISNQQSAISNQQSIGRFVSGRGFSRAESVLYDLGFSPCRGSPSHACTPLYTGLNSRNRATASGTRLSANSTSSDVVCFPRLKRMLPRARSADTPIAVSTWEGSMAPDEHAAPVEIDSPFRSSAITMASPSMQSKEIFVVLGTRAASPLFTAT